MRGPRSFLASYLTVETDPTTLQTKSHQSHVTSDVTIQARHLCDETSGASSPEDSCRVGVDVGEQRGRGGSWWDAVEQMPAAVAVGPVQPPPATDGRWWPVAQLGERPAAPLRAYQLCEKGGRRSTMVTFRPRTWCSTRTWSRTWAGTRCWHHRRITRRCSSGTPDTTISFAVDLPSTIGARGAWQREDVLARRVCWIAPELHADATQVAVVQGRVVGSAARR
jgi:hypothetical protein